MGNGVADIFNSLISHLTLDPIDIDNWNFKLHSKLSVGIFFAASAASFLTQHFGTPIECSGKDNEFVEQNCWLHGSYHIQNKVLGAAINRGENCYSPSPYQVLVNGEYNDTSERSDTNYYIWVTWVLLLNGALFILPYKLWGFYEGGMLKKFKLKEDEMVQEDQDEQNRLARDSRKGNSQGTGAETDAKLFFEVTPKSKRSYFWKFFGIECFNLAIVVSNFFIIDKFLSGKFLGYGIQVLYYFIGLGDSTEISLDNETIDKYINPMCNVFPTLVSCPTKTGSVVYGSHDTTNDLCILSQNLVNQIIYIIVWWWLVILLLSNGLMMTYRIAIIFNIADARRLQLRYLMKTKSNEKDSMTDKPPLEIGDWFLLAQIGQNSDAHFFRKLVKNVMIIFVATLNSPKRQKKCGGIKLKKLSEINTPNGLYLSVSNSSTNCPQNFPEEHREPDSTLIEIASFRTNEMNNDLTPNRNILDEPIATTKLVDQLKANSDHVDENDQEIINEPERQCPFSKITIKAKSSSNFDTLDGLHESVSDLSDLNQYQSYRQLNSHQDQNEVVSSSMSSFHSLETKDGPKDNQNTIVGPVASPKRFNRSNATSDQADENNKGSVSLAHVHPVQNGLHEALLNQLG